MEINHETVVLLSQKTGRTEEDIISVIKGFKQLIKIIHDKLIPFFKRIMESIQIFMSSKIVQDYYMKQAKYKKRVRNRQLLYQKKRLK